MKLKIRDMELEVRPLLAKDLVARGGIEYFSRDERVLIECVTAVNGEERSLSVFDMKDWRESDVRKAVKAVMSLSGLDLESGEDLYEVIERGDGYIVARVGGKLYKLEELTMAQVASIKRSKNDMETAARKLALAVKEVDGKKASLDYESVLEMKAGEFLGLLGAYGELVEGGYDRGF